MLYAEPTELKGKRCDIFSASNMSFPYHIHRTYEIMRVVKGTAPQVKASLFFRFNIIRFRRMRLRRYLPIFLRPNLSPNSTR